MLSLAIVTLSPSSAPISSSAGPIIRQGPHHSAQKSTRTGLSEPRTSEAKLWSVTVLVVMAGESPGKDQKLISIWAFGFAPSRHDFDELRAGCVQEGRADLPTGEDDLKGLDVGLHLSAMSIWDIGARPGHFAGLEIDHADPIALHAQAIDRAGNHPAVRERRRKWNFTKGSRAEQVRKTRVSDDAADLGDDLFAGRRVGDTGRP